MKEILQHLKNLFFFTAMIFAVDADALVCEISGELFDIGAFVKTDAFYDRGIYGQNINVANIELFGVDDEDYGLFLKDSNYVKYQPSYAEEAVPNRHASQTLGVMAGYNASYGSQNISTGLAYKASYTGVQLRESWSIFGNTTQKGILETYEHFFSNATDVISSSWMDASAMGSESAFPHIEYPSLILDSYARRSAGTTFVAVAANNGEAGSVRAPLFNMNTIKVGALDENSRFTKIASYSSYGPNDFYNPISHTIVKNTVSSVDISAPGTIYTVVNGGVGNASGTSYAAPIVSSVAALMHSYAKENSMSEKARDSRLVKSILLNSADKTPEWDNGLAITDNVNADGKTFDGVLSTTQSLDLKMGSGIVNAEKALEQYENFGATSFLSDVDFGGANVYEFLADENSVLSATLCWFVGADMREIAYDSSGNVSSFDSAASYFSDLNLSLWRKDDAGMTLLAQSVSEYNNVEHLYLTLEEGGKYVLQVNFEKMIYGSADSETYAIAWNSAVPEPSTYAVIFGALALGFAACRKRK